MTSESLSPPRLDDNPLLIPAEGLVDYSAVRPAHIEPAIRDLIARMRAAVDSVVSCPTAPDWENLVEPIEDVSERLHRAWAIAGHLNNVVNTPDLRKAYNACLPEMSELSTWMGLHQGLYGRYRQLADSETYPRLSATRRRIIDLALRDFRLSGVELEGKSRETFARNAELQARASQKFSENVMDATDHWSLQVTDEAQLEGIPQDVIEAARKAAEAAGEPGWRLVLHMPCYLPIMQHARNRDLRRTLYRAYGTRASDQGDVQYDNSELIESLLALRAEEAALLGFGNFATLRLQTRMAESPDQVLAFLHELARRARPSARKDLEELRAFAASELGLAELEPWDIAFASERLREQRYAYSDEALRPYFTESTVLNGLFEVIQTLFGVQLRKTDHATWHPDAHIYQVLDANQHEIGRLGIDLQARAGKQGGAWVDSERSRRRRQTALHIPLVWLTCNFPGPQDGHEPWLTHDDVITLFHESGHAMHALLSRVDDPGASAFSAVEWDAIEMPSQFMENFCWEWGVLQRLTRHATTGEPLPRELYDRMLAARNFQSGLKTLRQVEFALFDMLIHVEARGLSTSAVLDVLDQVRDEVALLKPPAWHRFPHAFGHLFAGGYAAGYYSYKWAEVLSADAYSAFEEAARPLDDGTRDVFEPATCQRYLDEVIAVGGSRPAAESFRAFRGRDPRLDALLRQDGLLEERP